MKSFFIYSLLLLSFFSCKKAEKQAEIDEDIITQYISDNNLDATPTGTGLYYVVDSVGSGSQPTNQSNVTVAYKGYFTDGSVFDESSSAGISFSLTSVIEGWQEGIPFYKVGGSGMLLVPSALGYGNRDRSGIPANSVLLFDVSLIAVQ